jgi:hypothetical protein
MDAAADIELREERFLGPSELVAEAAAAAQEYRRRIFGR